MGDAHEQPAVQNPAGASLAPAAASKVESRVTSHVTRLENARRMHCDAVYVFFYGASTRNWLCYKLCGLARARGPLAEAGETRKRKLDPD